MKLLIIEGIATSGKSTTIDKLKLVLGDMHIAVYGESDTHEPIRNQPSELHIAFFDSLVSKAEETGADLVVFDRLYLTQAYRAHATIADYKSVEASLAQYSTLTVFLTVDEAAIAQRVRLATLHRDEEWSEYVKTKGTTFTEIADYYINQQRRQLKLLKQSGLEHTIFDTTNYEYDRIVQEIVAKFG